MVLSPMARRGSGCFASKGSVEGFSICVESRIFEQRWSPKGTQFDLKQATGFEALSVVPMNTLLLIREKELKAQRLQVAQLCFAAHSEGINYTSAHLSPTKLSSIGS